VSWNDILNASALDQAALVARRELSSEELVRLYLDRIERIDPRLNAFVSVMRRRALADARVKDRMVREGAPLPVFHGVPIGIKDMNFVRFAWTRLGSSGTLPLFSPVDDKTAAAIRRGGFVILGKLATAELGAMPVTEPDIHPPTRNPWNPWHTPGGSSGGSGSAVAARMLPIAQGSDGAGSIRIPSSFCHLFGIKPSRGRVANAFGKPDRDILYTCGPIARTVDDAAALLDVLAGLDVGRPHWAPPPAGRYHDLAKKKPAALRMRVITQSPLTETDPEIAEAVVRAARVLEGLGHHVEEGSLPEASLEEFLPLWQRLIADMPLTWWRRTQPITRWLAEPGLRLRPEDVMKRYRELSARTAKSFDGTDILLTPTVAVPPPKVGAYAGRPAAEAFADAAKLGAYTAGFNLTGQPAASVPLGLTKDGLPMGLQVGGRLFSEDEVLAVSRQLEEAMPWGERVAPGGA
jgi:amidase